MSNTSLVKSALSGDSPIGFGIWLWILECSGCWHEAPTTSLVSVWLTFIISPLESGVEHKIQLYSYCSATGRKDCVLKKVHSIQAMKLRFPQVVNVAWKPHITAKLVLLQAHQNGQYQVLEIEKKSLIMGRLWQRIFFHRLCYAVKKER